MATCILGWSDADFWSATPRKYFAVLYMYSEIKGTLTAQPQQEVLVGKKALSALSDIAMRIR